MGDWSFRCVGPQLEAACREEGSAAQDLLLSTTVFFKEVKSSDTPVGGYFIPFLSLSFLPLSPFLASLKS